MRHVLEQVLEVDLLLVFAAERRGRGLPDDGHHRLVIHRGVVKAVEQVDRAGSRGREAYSGFAGKLCMGAGHECGQLLVTRLDEPGLLVARVLERGHDPVDPVPGIAKDPLHSPRAQPLVEKIAHRLCHTSLRVRVVT